jgi:hypothetical protein
MENFPTSSGSTPVAAGRAQAGAVKQKQDMLTSGEKQLAQLHIVHRFGSRRVGLHFLAVDHHEPHLQDVFDDCRSQHEIRHRRHL